MSGSRVVLETRPQTGARSHVVDAPGGTCPVRCVLGSTSPRAGADQPRREDRPSRLDASTRRLRSGTREAGSGAAPQDEHAALARASFRTKISRDRADQLSAFRTRSHGGGSLLAAAAMEEPSGGAPSVGAPGTPHLVALAPDGASEDLSPAVEASPRPSWAWARHPGAAWGGAPSAGAVRRCRACHSRSRMRTHDPAGRR